MINKIEIHSDFAGVPYLSGCDLVQKHNGTIELSTSKPNVLVGPNGSGKSSLLTALAIKTLSYFSGVSTLDSHFVRCAHEYEIWWTKEQKWSSTYEFLKGFIVTGDGAPAMYYRPGHIPGNGESIAYAMMTGYMKEARIYGELVDKKSSGEQCRALLNRFLDVLSGITPMPLTFVTANDWEKNALAKHDKNHRNAMPWDFKGAILDSIAQAAVSSPGHPLLMMDEPEQSLDTRSEMTLWRAISQADCTKMQILVATHSVYPLLHPNQFNIIEAAPGYVDAVNTLLHPN